MARHETRFKAAGIPTIAVLLSGRPLYVNPQINAAGAFVAAWLPGSEGAGIADVLTGKCDFTGRLAFSWPRRPDQTPLNVGDAHNVCLTGRELWNGYGLSFGDSNTPRIAYAGTQVALPGLAALAVEPGHDGIRATRAGRHEAWLDVAADAPSDIAREANRAMMLGVRLTETRSGAACPG